MNRHSRGFSLLEVLIATFIFSIVMVSVVSYFVNITAANQNTKRLQQNLEDTRFAMNRIAKVLRTSVVVTPSSNASNIGTLRVYDYSQAGCVEYTFDSNSNSLRERFAVKPGTETNEKTWCRTTSSLSSPSSLVNVMDGTFAGHFNAVPSKDTASAGSGNEEAGRVIISATIARRALSSTIQTTVSLRNYEEIAP
jgi:prepilin-type N-terminal cleavage/methylation domain-containing protein